MDVKYVPNVPRTKIVYTQDKKLHKKCLNGLYSSTQVYQAINL